MNKVPIAVLNRKKEKIRYDFIDAELAYEKTKNDNSKVIRVSEAEARAGIKRQTEKEKIKPVVK